MNLDDFKNTWQQHTPTTDAAIEINQTVIPGIKINKQIDNLAKMKVARIIESIFFFFIIVSLWQYIVADFTVSAPKVSAFILNVFAIIGLAGNIGQIVLISNLDYAAPVSTLQKNIFAVCLHKLQLTKLILLSVPFYMTYVFFGFDVLFSVDLYQHLASKMVIFYSISSLFLLTVTLWLVCKLHYKNIDTPWVKRTIGFIVGERLIEMAQFINNLESSQDK